MLTATGVVDLCARKSQTSVARTELRGPARRVRGRGSLAPQGWGAAEVAYGMGSVYTVGVDAWGL